MNKVLLAILAAFTLFVASTTMVLAADDGKMISGIAEDGTYIMAGDPQVETDTTTTSDGRSIEVNVNLRQSFGSGSQAQQPRQTRQNTASGTTATGDYASKGDLERLADKRYADAAGESALTRAKDWAGKKFQEITDKMSGMETAEETQDTKLKDHDDRISKVEKELDGDPEAKDDDARAGLKARTGAAEGRIKMIRKGLGFTAWIAWIALIMAAIALLTVFIRGRGNGRSRSEEEEPGEPDHSRVTDPPVEDPPVRRDPPTVEPVMTEAEFAAHAARVAEAAAGGTV